MTCKYSIGVLFGPLVSVINVLVMLMLRKIFRCKKYYVEDLR
jgi:hypothetical protein